MGKAHLVKRSRALQLNGQLDERSRLADESVIVRQMMLLARQQQLGPSVLPLVLDKTHPGSSKRWHKI